MLVYRDSAITTRYPNNIVLVKKLGVCKVEEIELQTEMVYDEETQQSSESVLYFRTVVGRDRFRTGTNDASLVYRCFSPSYLVKSANVVEAAKVKICIKQFNIV